MSLITTDGRRLVIIPKLKEFMMRAHVNEAALNKYIAHVKACYECQSYACSVGPTLYRQAFPDQDPPEEIVIVGGQ